MFEEDNAFVSTKGVQKVHTVRDAPRNRVTFTRRIHILNYEEPVARWVTKFYGARTF